MSGRNTPTSLYHYMLIGGKSQTILSRKEKLKVYTFFLFNYNPQQKNRRVNTNRNTTTFSSFCLYYPTSHFALITTILFRAFACPF